MIIYRASARRFLCRTPLARRAAPEPLSRSLIFRHASHWSREAFDAAGVYAVLLPAAA